MKRKSTLRSLLVLAGSSLLTISSSHAATLYWDGSSTTANADGGTGNWDNNNLANWGTLALVGTNSVWLNSTPDFAVFGGTAGTVSLTSAITAGGITFNTTGYTIQSNTLTFGGTNNTVALNNIAAATISSAIGTSAANMTFSALNPFTAGTLTFGAAGGWTGTTTVNAGITLQLNSASTALLNTSGITLKGGSIRQNYTSIGNRINDSAAITSYGGSLLTSNPNTAGAFTETIGAVTLERGLTTFLHDQSLASLTSQTLTLTSFTRNGTSAVNFASNGSLNTTKNIMTVSGATATPAGQIIGAWATVGNTAGAFDYAVYDDSLRIVGVNMAGSGQATWTVSGGVYNNNVVAQTLGATRTISALRNTAASATLTLATGVNLDTYGVLNGAATIFIIAPGTGGALRTPSGGGQLHLNAGNGTAGGAMTISAPINDNGTVTVVKNGFGNLSLSSTTSNFSGGLVLNAGSFNTEADTNLGSGGGITVNGTVSWGMGAATTIYNRTLTLNDGAVLTLTSGNSGKTVTGVLSGNGSLFANHSTDFIFSNAANTFQGAILSATAVSAGYGLTFASIGDLAGAGLITLVGGSGTFHWTSASGSTTTLANRQFAISGTGSGLIVAKGTTAASNLVINKDLLLTGAAGVRTLTLDGTNLGNNTFAGLIANGTDGGASVVSLTKNGASLWILSGTNSYSGTTTLSAGTLVVSSSANLGNGSAANSLVFNGGTLRADGAFTSPSTRGVTMTGAGTINTNGNALTIGGIITGAGALTKTGAADLTLSNDNTFTGTTTITAGKVVMTNALALQNSSYTTTGSNGTIGLDVTSGLSSGNLTLGGLAGAVNLVSAFTAGYGTVTQLTLNPQAGISNTYSAVIANGSGNMALTKTGAGTQVLSGTNTYSGATTITAGILNANASAALGNGSATNTLVFDGGILQAAAAITSAATRGVTMTGTGIIDTNNFAISIAGNITDAGGLTKNGFGTLTLSGTNNYSGVTTVNLGTLAIANETALASNTAAKLNVKGGTFLRLNVNAAGTNGFTVANLDALLGNISVANTAAQGLQFGVTIAIDTTNAGGSFTQGNAFTDSTGAFGGKISLTKVGSGTLVLDETNTYTGTTTLSVGTLEVTGSIATSSNIINNAALLFNSGSAQSFPNPITGTGTISKSGAGTLTLAGSNTISGTTTITAGDLTLSNVLALRNSALVTTGAGTVTLSGVTSPTFGGLSGASGNLVDIITNYSTVTNLAFNPGTGVTHTYGGVIGEGATGMTLTKTGAGTQVLTGANLYTGATIINQGTLNLGGATATGSLASTVLTLSGGTLSYTRTGTNTQSFTTTNITSRANQVSTSLASQTLELNNIVRSVGGTINFGNTGTITTTNTLSNDTLGGWATVNNDNWATKTGANITALGIYTGASVTAATNLNTNMDAGTVTISGVINTNSIRFSGASAKTLTLATGDNIIQSGGILVRNDVAANASTITGGNLAGSASGDLVIHQHNANAAGALTIGSLIANNTAATALTKSGAGNLILTNNGNTYTGGTFLNAGTLTYTNDGQLGTTASARNITFGSAATLVGFNGSILNTLSANTGAVGTLSAHGYAITTTAGSGTLNYSPNATNSAVTNLGNASTFTGNIAALMGASTNSNPIIQFSAINDAAGSALQFGGNNGDSQQNVTIRYLGTAALVFNNRSIELLAPSGTNNTAAFANVQNNSVNASHTWTINTNFVMSTTQNRSLSLQGTNTGDNAFNGVIGNGLGTTNLRKQETGTWILSGTNTFTGSTTVSGGRLSLNNLNAAATTSSVTVASGGTLAFPIAGTYNIPGIIAIAGNGATLPGGAGALWFGQGGSNTSTLNAPINVTAVAKIGSYGNTMSPILGGQISGGTAAGTLALTIQSQGGNSAGDVHTWTLNAASIYSGTTTFTESGGVLSNTLKLGIANALPTATTLTLAPVTAGKNTRLDLNGQSQQLAGLLNTGTAAQAIVFNGGAGTPILRIDIAGSNTFSGNLGPGGTSFALTKNLSGDLILSGTNTYTGNTTINNGRITVSAANNLSSGATSIVQSGTGQLFVSGAGATFSNNFNISTTGYLEASDSQNNIDGAIRLDGTNTLSGTITLSGNSRIGAVNATATNTISGKITGNFGIDFYGMNLANTQAHTFTLSNNANDYTGATTIINSNYNNAGYTGVSTILRLGTSNVIPNGASAGNIVFAINGTNPNNIVRLDLASFSETINGLSVGAGANANITNSVAGASTLTIGDNHTTSSFGGTITDTTGTLAITKIGNGTLTLSGTNTYTGATTVNGGTLLINGSTSNTSLVTVGINGTLGGTGTVGGNTTISGIHSPGNSPGIQTFIGNLSYVDAGTPDPTVNWKLASNTTTVGVNPTANFDQIIVAGNLDFTHPTYINLSFNGAGSTVLWSDSLWNSNQSWFLYDVTGLGTTTNIANLNLITLNWLDSGSNPFSTAGGSFTLGQSGEDVMLNFTAIPEPSTYGIALSAIALALAAVRRQRRKKS